MCDGARNQGTTLRSGAFAIKLKELSQSEIFEGIDFHKEGEHDLCGE